MADFDVIVIGSGPGGYVCAIRCAQLGLKTACVEGRETLGGTCLNVGCIPSKALLHSTHMYHEVHDNFEKMGLMGGAPTVDWEKMQAYRASCVESNVTGVEFLFEKNGVTWLKGWGSIPAAGQVKVGDEVHNTKHIVIATGSDSKILSGIDVDEERIVTSTGALVLKEIPKSMVVIGAGVIGLELGSVYQRLGAEVTVIASYDRIMRRMDLETSRTFQRILKRQGMNFVVSAATQGIERTDNGVKITWKNKKNDKPGEIEVDVALLSTGRNAYTDGLGLEATGVELNEWGQVKVGDHWQTNVPGIYAIGDVIPGPMLAHKAEDEGMAVAEHLAGNHGHVNYGVIPDVVYTTPEVATVGKTEEEVKEEGREYKVGKFSFKGNGRARVIFQDAGFVKIIADKETDRILGCHIVGPSAGDLIHEVCVAMQFGASAQDLALTCHAHPTVSEAVREAALACGLGAIHA